MRYSHQECSFLEFPLDPERIPTRIRTGTVGSYPEHFTWSLELSDTGWRVASELNTPRSENNTNFGNNAQEKAATRGGQRGAL